jgi:hypothetical protein
MAKEENENTNAELTIQDLSSIKSIIDVASQRGAFKPNEMVAVGQTYVKLEGFLAAIEEQQKQATESDSATETSDTVIPGE